MPNPFSEIVKMFLKTFFLLSLIFGSFAGKTSIPITISLFSSFIPVTPEVARPIGLAFVSGKRIDLPNLVSNIMWLSP